VLRARARSAAAEKEFFEAKRKEAEAAEAAKREAEQQHVASLTEEEREQYLKDKADAAKHEEKKSKMLSSQLSGYAKPNAALRPG
jgi:hypothetical protein